MNLINDTNGVSRVEGVALSAIAERCGTPCYVYSRAALTAAYASYQAALAGRNARICYAVKANSNIAILNLFARLGAGFDIVSGGELARVIAAGGDPAKVVFSGVAKSRAEMQQALAAGIHCFNVESASELETLNAVAGEMGRRAPVALRVNPNVDPKTHPYISTGLKTAKFGVAFTTARELYRRAHALPNLEIRGVACHIGSQLLDPGPAADAAGKVLELVDSLAAEGIVFEHIDLGGGMGIRYRDEAVLPTADYLAPMLARLTGRQEMLFVEPGRSLVGNAGLLLTRVAVLKHGEEKNFAIVDAAMNDLARPALYDAWHEIVKVVGASSGGGPVSKANGGAATASAASRRHHEVPGSTAAQGGGGAGGTATTQAAQQLQYEIVGPICESGDFLGHDRNLALAEGDLLAILSAGAYGMAMSSNYNTRPRAAEVMVDGEQMHLIRRREDIAQLFALESVLP